MLSARSVGESAEGLVRATVDGRGRLVELELTSRRYRRLSSAALSDAILDAVHKAAAALDALSAVLMEPALPTGESFEDSTSGH